MAGIRTRMIASVRAGLSSTPSMRGLAVSGTQLFIGNLLSTNTFIGTKGSTASAVTGFVRQANLGPDIILGVCEDNMAAATTDSTTYVRFTPALPHVIFQGCMDDGTGIGTCQNSQLYQTFGVTLDVTNKLWYIDVNKPSGTASTAYVRIVDLVDAPGTQAGRVNFIFVPGVTMLGTNA